MEIYCNNLLVGYNLLTLRQKIKKVNVAGIANNSLITLKYRNGTKVNYRVVIKSVDTKKKKGLTKVLFKHEKV